MQNRLRRATWILLLPKLAALPPVVPDLDGREVAVLAGGGVNAAVLVFVGADCPISNRYAPELERLQQELGPRGVAFFLVYPEPSLDAATARRHRADYRLTLRALLDREHRLVAHTGVEVTPEAAVLGPGGDVLYRGRIDDRWLDFNQRRPRASRHELRDAIEAILDGRPPAPAGGRAVGCYIEPLPEARSGS